MTARDQNIVALRARSIEEARRLRAGGWLLRPLADRLGVSVSTVVRWTTPGAAERGRAASLAWKRANGGLCIDCGRRTSLGNAKTNSAPSERCADCRRAYERQEFLYWTRERALEAARIWAREHGRPPGAKDWIHADPDRRWPNSRECYGGGKLARREGWHKWNDFLAAAGLPTLEPGHKHGQRGSGRPALTTREKSVGRRLPESNRWKAPVGTQGCPFLAPLRGGRPSFWVEPDTGCWIWQGTLNSKGYACRKSESLGQKLVHRGVFEWFYFTLDHGDQVHHKCERTACVNPWHLTVHKHLAHERLHAGENGVSAIALSELRDGPKRAKEIAAAAVAAGHRETSANVTLGRMLSRGEIVRVRRGVYALPEAS